MPELTISAEQVGYLIEKAREFDAKDEATDVESGSNASDDRMIDANDIFERHGSVSPA